MSAGQDNEAKSAPSNFEQSLNRRIAAGLGIVVTLTAAVVGWAANSTLSSAVIAPGQVVVEGSLKKVQHLQGGVVGEILVKNGDNVAAGDLLLKLDDTQTRASLGIVTAQLIELKGRAARLTAIRDDAQSIAFTDGFEHSGPEARRVMQGETRLFEVLRKTAEGKKDQLRERIGQLRHETKGLEKQEAAKAREQELIAKELARLRQLHEKQLVPQTRLLAMERDETRIEGEHGTLLAQIARTSGQISETELQILDLGATAVSDAQKELREVEARIAELEERRIAGEDTLRRVELRAPRAGIVHELAANTVGGVIGPGDTVLSIVPSDDKRSIEVRLNPTDIDQITVGQKARLRFSAFNQRTTPELDGRIERVAAELSHDRERGLSYYTARVEVAEAEIAKLEGKVLVPGMPVETYIQTGDRTALSYLTKPFTDQVARAFKEE